MPTCLVYDLHPDGQAYKQIGAVCEKLGGVKPFTTTWFFPAGVAPATVWNAVQSLFDKNDKAPCFTGSGPPYSWHYEDWNKWFPANLR